MSILNFNVVYYRRIEKGRMEFEEKARLVSEKVQKALHELGNIQRQVDREWIQMQQDVRREI